MNNDRYHKLHALFARAKGLRGDAREAFLDEACGDDAVLRSELVSMIRDAEETVDAADVLSDKLIDAQRKRIDQVLRSGSSGQVTSFMSGGLSSASGGNGSGATVGRYHIRRRIASGGMGSVYEAEQGTPKRRVALKMVHTNRITPALIERLQRESEILGRLQHPGVAQVYDAGMLPATGDGPHGDMEQPYFAMEFIDGVALTKYCDLQKLDDRKRLELLALVCDALQYAHDKGVIHRDLKPDNILVDEHGHPKVLDFGIARVTEDPVGSAMTMTGAGQVLGTIAYMAPEQMDGASTITPRADVYALGVLGFELLSKRLPHDLTGKSSVASLKYLMQNDPPKLGAIASRFAGDVQTIIDKALEREPTRRYESAAALAGDIRRFLNDEPILARPPSATYVATKFIRRNRTLVSSALVVFLVLLAGITGTTIASIRTERARQETVEALSELEMVAAYQQSQLALDPAAMGIRMYDDMVDMYRASFKHTNENEPEIEEAVSGFEDSLARINFTTFASNTVEHNILEQSLDAIDEQFADMPIVRAQLLESMAATMKLLGLNARALETQTDALQIYRDQLGDDNAATLLAQATQCELGVLGRIWKPETRIAKLIPTVEGLTSVVGEEHPATLQMTLLLSGGMSVYGDASRSEDLLTQVQETANVALGPAHLTTIQAGLQRSYRLRGQERIELRKQLYETCRTVLGEDDPLTLDCLKNMAVYYLQSGNYEEAERSYRFLYENNRRKYGDRHPNTTSVHGPLATTLEILNRLDEAERLYLQRLDTKRDHPWVVEGLNANIAFVYYKQGRFDGAIAIMREAIASCKKRGKDSGKWVSLHSNLSLMLADGGLPEEGEQVARDILQFIEAPGENQSALDANARRRGSNLSAITRAHLGRAIYQQQRYEEAEVELLAAYEQIFDERGPKHHRTNRVLIFLVDLYDDWHEAQPDQGYDVKADEWYEKLIPVFDRTKRAKQGNEN